MKLLSSKVGSMLAAAGLLFMATPAQATQVNSPGTACQAYNASQVTDIDYLISGVRNLAGTARSVICPIMRTPLDAGVSTGTVWVTGYNSGATTSITVYAMSTSGTVLGSQSTSSSASSYTIPLNFTSSQLNFATMTSALVTLPATSSSVYAGTFIAP